MRAKFVNQSSDFPVRRTGSYRHKKALLISCVSGALIHCLKQQTLCRTPITQNDSAVKLSPKRACERPCSRMSSTTSLFSSRLEMISSIAFMTTMPWICKTALLASRPRGAQLAVWSSSISRNFSNVSLTEGLLSNILHNNKPRGVN